MYFLPSLENSVFLSLSFNCSVPIYWHELPLFRLAYYPGPTGEFTGSSVGHKYLRKNGMNLPIVALNRSLQDLSIGV